jgi:hypothetical protein
VKFSFFPIAGAFILFFLTGCCPSDKCHSKKHLDAMKEDLNSAHKDIDSLLGLDKPSSLVEKD